MTSGDLRAAIVRQFAQPRGPLGWLAGQIMAHRPSNRVRNRRTIELLDPKPGDRVLEIGFGPGLAIAEILPRLSSGHLVGLDHSLAMLQQAAKHNQSAVRNGRVTLCLGTLANCRFAPESFDKAYAVNVHLFWSEAEEELRRIAALLKPGGALALTHQPRYRAATNADAESQARNIGQQMLNTGFSDIRLEVFPMRPVNAVCVLARRTTEPV